MAVRYLVYNLGSNVSSTVSVLWTRFNFLIVAVKGLNITMAKKKG